MAAQKAALEQSTKFLEEAKIKSKEKETYKKNIDGEVEKLQKEAKDIESGISKGSGDAAKNASEPLKKLIKRGMYSCEGRDKEGLIQVTEKIKFGDEEKVITYCYYSECDGQLFLKNNFDEFTGSDDYLYQTAGEGCFNINLKKGDDKIEGTIKFGFKSKPVKGRITPDKKDGILFKTKLEFHKNNHEANKFTNTVIYLVSNAENLEWKRKGAVKTWEDSNKDQYTYESIKDKFKKQEYKGLDFWKHDSSRLGTGKSFEKLTDNMVQKYLNIFDKGSDLWDWSEDNINKGKEDFKFGDENNVILKFVNSNKYNPGFWWKKSLE